MHLRIVCVSFFVTALSASLPVDAALADQPKELDFNQTYQAALGKAQDSCRALWASRTFDRLRAKIPLDEQKPTFSQLKDTEKLSAKERPIADLAIKVVEQCRSAYQPVYALLPPQMLKIIEGVQRRQDAKIAELYNRKITYGEFNASMNELTGEFIAVVSGLVRNPKSNEAPAVAVTNENSPPVSPVSTIRSGSYMALIIGNSAYGSLPKLSNPVNDGKSIADVLKAMGYQTKLVLDGSEQSIRREIRQFANDTERADVALVFYAGHGAQVGGSNYLLPIDMEIPRTEADIQFSGFKVDDLINSIRSTTKIVFLDACRDNPALFKNIVRGRGASPAGLAPATGSNFEQKPGSGIFIAYATDAGSVADDGLGKHSPFTDALLRNIRKPISIDDMFSLVTKEVRLVTKNAQRPYKYASLESIVCLAPNCSNVSPVRAQVVDDPIEQAQRSEADELAIAKSSKNVAALESFLAKYPDSSSRSEVDRLTDDWKRAEFTEWTLVAIGDQRIPWFAKLSSIRKLGDRSAISLKTIVDPNQPKVFLGKSLPAAETIEQVNAYGCGEAATAVSEQTIYDSAQTILYHYKFADPEYLDLSVGFKLAPGSVGRAIRNIACNDELGTPSVSRGQLLGMKFRSLSSTLSGDGEIFFEPISRLDKESNERNFLFIMRFHQDKLVSIEPAAITNLGSSVPSYRIEIDKARLICVDKKMAAVKSEFYDEKNRLVYMTARDPDVAIADWIEIKDNVQSPLSTLYRILCSSNEATK